MFSYRKFNGESKSGLRNTNFLLEQTFMGILKIFLYKSLRTSIIAHSRYFFAFFMHFHIFTNFEPDVLRICMTTHFKAVSV